MYPLLVTAAIIEHQGKILLTLRSGADRNVVAMVQAQEAILKRDAGGQAGCVVEVNAPGGGLVLRMPGNSEPEILYREKV